MATATQNTFTIDIDNVFEIIKQRSAIKAKILGDIDKYAITEDEKSWCLGVLEQGSAELFKRISADAQDVDDAYEYDATTDMEISYKLLQPTYFDENLLTPFLNAMTEYLVNFILVKWWALVIVPDEQVKSKLDMDEAIAAIYSIYSARTTRPSIKYRSF